MSALQDRVAVITGAAGVLGQACVAHFQEQSAQVAAVDLAAERLQELSGATAYPCDLTSDSAVRDTFQSIHQTHGRIDILANVAGGFAMGGRVEETTMEDWLEMFRINAMTAWLACRHALPFMREANFGRIINIGARAVRKPGARMAPYCSSKATVVTMTEVLACECADTGITANCILPGTIDTPRNRADMPNADHSRWVPPHDIAVVIAQLADPNNTSVNGAVIPVYGRS